MNVKYWCWHFKNKKLFSIKNKIKFTWTHSMTKRRGKGIKSITKQTKLIETNFFTINTWLIPVIMMILVDNGHTLPPDTGCGSLDLINQKKNVFLFSLIIQIDDYFKLLWTNQRHTHFTIVLIFHSSSLLFWLKEKIK